MEKSRPGGQIVVGILAGEASGDILGAGLMRELKKSADIVFTGIGGPLMIAEGLESQVPMDRLSVMGLIEPLKRLPELLTIRRNLYKHCLDQKIDIFIGIDSPDFTLSLERRLRQQGIITVHYVSPSVWAWRQQRIKKVVKAVDLLMTLFPFEEHFYSSFIAAKQNKNENFLVKCVGHPLADEIPVSVDIKKAKQKLDLNPDYKVLALLPGSRKGEVEKMAAAFLDVAKKAQESFAGLQVIVPCANEQRRAQLDTIIANQYPDIQIKLFNAQSRAVIAAADVVLVASGTATLEALLFKKPMIVCYRMSTFSYFIISKLIKVPFFSLPNLLAGKKLVPELVQDQVNISAIFPLLKQYLEEEEVRNSFHQEFLSIHQSLKLNASVEAARAVLDLLSQKNAI